jgi:uncharacterized protein DUF3768
VNTETITKAERIRELNDALRRTFSGGRMVMTTAVQSLPPDTVALALTRTQTFNEFTSDNDPYGEHDFGGFDLAGEKFFWKIDYYDERCEFGSEDPSDPKKTSRVLTLMLASDY